MAEEKKDTWTSYVALSTAVVAIIAALTTLYMGKFSSRTILQQAQESDKWAFYQAKSIKGHTYALQKEAMELYYLSQKGRMPKDTAERYKKTIESYDESIKRYDSEKKQIMAEAEAHARDKALAQTRSGKFAVGLIFLQISIMLSSIAALTKKRPLWYAGLASAALGMVFFADGFYLFY